MADDNSLNLPLCAFCGAVAARCACPSVEVGGANEHGYSAHFCAPDTPLDVFADGSGTTDDRPCGAGIVVMRAGYVLAEASVSIGNGTNNLAEAYALEHALRWIGRDYSPQVRARVHSDSEWALTASHPDNDWKLKDTPARAVILRVRALRKKLPRVTFHKVKGHSGVHGNERADELAGLARRRLVNRLESEIKKGIGP